MYVPVKHGQTTTATDSIITDEMWAEVAVEALEWARVCEGIQEWPDY